MCIHVVIIEKYIRQAGGKAEGTGGDGGERGQGHRVGGDKQEAGIEGGERGRGGGREREVR